MKKLSINKLTNLFVMAVLLFFSSLEVKAQFDFFVVDSTYGGYVLNPHSNNSNYHQLTDTNFNVYPYQRIALWSKPDFRIDITKDFSLNFRLYFGNGTENASSIGSGIAFVMHLQNDTNLLKKLVGGSLSCLGYASNGMVFWQHIAPSFAVEFDTQNNGNTSEGGVGPYTECHTAYLRNASMTAIIDHTGNSTYQPMQNDFETVRNKNILVSVTWLRKNGIDGSAGYYLITCIEEKGNNSDNGKMIERNRMHFVTLNDLIAGLSEQNNFLTWGITASTGANLNIQGIEFISFLNGNGVEPCASSSSNPHPCDTCLAPKKMRWFSIDARKTNDLAAIEEALSFVDSNWRRCKCSRVGPMGHVLDAELDCDDPSANRMSGYICLSNAGIDALSWIALGQHGSQVWAPANCNKITDCDKFNKERTIIYCCDGELHIYDYSHMSNLTNLQIGELITELTDSCKCRDCKKTIYLYEFCPGRFIEIDITCKTSLVFLGPALAMKVCECRGIYTYLSFTTCDPVPDCPICE